MENEINPFGRSLKNFRKLFRPPPEEQAFIEPVNVYRHTKAFSMNLSHSNSITTNNINRSHDPSPKPRPLPSLKTTKFIIVKKNFSKPLITSQELQKNTQNSIFNKKVINIDKLTQLSQKESIIFNQVKKFDKKIPENLYSSVNTSEFHRSSKSKINVFQKLGTMKKALFSEDSATCEPAVEEQKTLTQVQGKRKQLKGQIWKWVGSSGDIVY